MKLQVAQIVIIAVSSVSLLLSGRTDAAFVTSPSVGCSRATPFLRVTTSTQLQSSFAQPDQYTDALSSILLPTTASSSSSMNSLWLATVDSDIAKLSDNEFAPIFLGGVMVMVGGVISAMIVGLILEKRDLYANVVADSYAQGNAEDEAFWKGLSDEEKKKTQEAIQRLRQSKAGQSTTSEAASIVAATQSLTTTVVSEEPDASTPATAVVETGASQSATKKLDMFSDYADS